MAQIAFWARLMEEETCETRAFFLSGIGLWSAPLMVVTTLLSLYLSWVMHEQDVTISETYINRMYLQKQELATDDYTDQDNKQEDPSVVKLDNNQYVDNTYIEKLDSTVQMNQEQDIESQHELLSLSKQEACGQLIRGTAIMTFNLMTLIIFALSIQVFTHCLSANPSPFWLRCFLWYAYGIVCVFASIGAGCWLKLLRNLGGQSAIERLPIRADIAAQGIGHIAQGVSYVVEGTLFGVGVTLGIAVVSMWWVVWRAWKLVSRVF